VDSRRGRRAAAVLVVLLGLSACTGGGSSGAADPSTTTSVSGSPGSDPPRCGYQLAFFPVTVRAQGRVDPELARDAQLGIRYAQEAYRAKIPICEPGRVRVKVLDRDRGSVAGQTLVQDAPAFTIEIFAKGAFARTPAVYRPIVLLHEWYHVLEFAFMDCGERCLPLSDPVPDWLIEGAAVEESLFQAADLQIGFYSFFRSEEIAQAEQVNEPLEDLEKIRLPGDRYGLAFAAVELLVRDHGHASLERFWARTGATGDWEAAFRRTFGEPVSRFYRRFETYRANGFR
jgi:hypothetical protein